MYGHCQKKGKMIILIASQTTVTMSGLRLCTRIFCSVRASSSNSRQLSGPSCVTSNRKFAPDLKRKQFEREE